MTIFKPPEEMSSFQHLHSRDKIEVHKKMRLWVVAYFRGSVEIKDSLTWRSPNRWIVEWERNIKSEGKYILDCHHYLLLFINFFTFNVSVFSMFPGADLTESLQAFLRFPIVSWLISLWLVSSDRRESQESLENSFLHFMTILWTLHGWIKYLT